MKTILFVDHIFHQKTKSSDFFVNLLSDEFHIETLYVDPRVGLPAEFTIPGHIQIVVIWQLDYLAPIFLNLGVPTVVIPMFDGSGGMPPAHWRLSSEAHYISFSLHLHERINQAGCKSTLVKYYPPVPDQAVEYFSGNHCFFWQRTPASLDWGMINHLFGENFSSLHLHNAPDGEVGIGRTLVPDVALPYQVTVSTWYEELSKLDQVLSRCNLYVAPRMSEGIGMAFLEAMARGCCVMANDAPSHNEYILPGVNGILFDTRNSNKIAIQDPQSHGRWARQSMIEGRANWLRSDEPRILEYIRSIKTTPTRTKGKLHQPFVEELIHSYQRSFWDYTALLQTNDRLISEISGVATPRELSSGSIPVRNTILDFRVTEIRRKSSTQGFDHEREDGLWANEQYAEVLIPIAPGEREITLLGIEMRAPQHAVRALTVDLFINDEPCSSAELLPSDNGRWIRCITPISSRGAGALRIKIVSNYLLTCGTVDATGLPKLEGVGVRAIGLYETEQIPMGHFVELESATADWLSDQNQRRAYAIWCLQHGKQLEDPGAIAGFDQNLMNRYTASQYLAGPNKGSKRLADALWLTRGARYCKLLGEVPFHGVMDLLLERRPDVVSLTDLLSDDGIARYLGWYYLVGTSEYGVESTLCSEELSWLQQPVALDTRNASDKISRILYFVWVLRGDVHDAFDILTETGRANLRNWATTYGIQEFDRLARLLPPTLQHDHGSKVALPA